ncbi:winged helix-turn-helix transcriptional regulator [Nocardioides litoris]|uniref:winged helix-turn-helix transcriptional regulator n=1 Tax=Nocardioides litoris TaxID=1926648 RepID=UPI0011237A5E|nr:helix-turn-helix domain-containing protein [Nocardioides litoris]
MPDTSQRLVLTADHREVLAQVLDKWSVLVLEELCEAPRRFNELRRLVPVTQKSLTATLRRLERNGIVDREVVDVRPVAVRYHITPLGKTLRDPVDAVLRWTVEHGDEIEQARTRYDAEPASSAPGPEAGR